MSFIGAGSEEVEGFGSDKVSKTCAEWGKQDAVESVGAAESLSDSVGSGLAIVCAAGDRRDMDMDLLLRAASGDAHGRVGIFGMARTVVGKGKGIRRIHCPVVLYTRENKVLTS